SWPLRMTRRTNSPSAARGSSAAPVPDIASPTPQTRTSRSSLGARARRHRYHKLDGTDAGVGYHLDAAHTRAIRNRPGAALARQQVGRPLHLRRRSARLGLQGELANLEMGRAVVGELDENPVAGAGSFPAWLRRGVLGCHEDRQVEPDGEVNP